MLKRECLTADSSLPVIDLLIPYLLCQMHYGLYTEWTIRTGGLHMVPSAAKHAWIALIVAREILTLSTCLMLMSGVGYRFSGCYMLWALACYPDNCNKKVNTERTWTQNWTIPMWMGIINRRSITISNDDAWWLDHCIDQQREEHEILIHLLHIFSYNDSCTSE